MWARQILPGHYGVLGYLCMSAKTFDEILNRIQRYQTLVSDIGFDSVEPQEDLIEINYFGEYQIGEV